MCFPVHGNGNVLGHVNLVARRLVAETRATCVMVGEVAIFVRQCNRSYNCGLDTEELAELGQSVAASCDSAQLHVVGSRLATGRESGDGRTSTGAHRRTGGSSAAVRFSLRNWSLWAGRG